MKIQVDEEALARDCSKIILKLIYFTFIHLKQYTIHI